MAFDLMVGKSSKVKDAPDIVGRIEFAELPALASLTKRIDSLFLNRVSNFFDDQAFSVDEVNTAIQELHPLLLVHLKDDERAMLYKLLAVLSYASARNMGLFGVAD